MIARPTKDEDQQETKVRKSRWPHQPEVPALKLTDAAARNYFGNDVTTRPSPAWVVSGALLETANRHHPTPVGGEMIHLLYHLHHLRE